MERAFATVARGEVFAQTGIQIMPFNTLFQLVSMVERKSPLLDVAATFLTMPDLLNYWLSGAKVCEYSNATTTQMFNTATGRWATDLLDRLSISTKMLPEIVPPGTRLGAFEGIAVIAPATHDTGSAVAGIPATQPNFGYISSGTWSLAGIEVSAPVINDATMAANITNEGGVFGTIRLLKNVMGLWILQQCRQTWQATGSEFTCPELVRLAQEARPLRSVFNVNAPVFLPHGDHPAHIQRFCMEHSQTVPTTPGQIARAVLESLALAYRDVFEKLEVISGRSIDVIHIIGGGAENELLNQMTADATGKPVIAGPVEATVLGNALLQLIALGELGDLAEARQVVAGLKSMQRFEPQHSPEWQAAFERYKQL
jgi:rhamnulokinase